MILFCSKYTCLSPPQHITAKTVYHIWSRTSTIDFSGLKSGVYFVQMTGEKNVSLGKFVKQWVSFPY